MTKQEKDEAVLKIIISEVAPQLEKKFRDGMAKYEGALIDKDCLAEAVPEALDLLIYLSAERFRKQQAAKIWQIIQHRLDSSPVIQEPDGFKLHMTPIAKLFIRELNDYFAPKPLAQKIPAAVNPPGDSDYAAFVRFVERWNREQSARINTPPPK